eukprot:TRINITY_DN54087_c0_g1_i1.p1 TRINITY_DN54087_c0_g1~~TRINITY_DN54087_c0_g1_i1.p1  ORF type:complete len:140 (+),score=17.07 TRINITY_DN54087_c0_g1_i1:3-422(+)
MDTSDQYLAGLAAYEGFKSIPPVTSPKHWSEVVDQKASKIVYLSADSTNLLQKLEGNCTYVVGAFVDHNTKKGLTEENAKKYGVETARLPLDETIAVGNMCKAVSYTHLRAHETVLDLVCRLLLEKKKQIRLLRYKQTA